MTHKTEDNTQIETQIETHFNLKDFTIEQLDIPVNDVIAVTTRTGKDALKLYNISSRGIKDVQWEIDLILHLIQNGAPIVKPIKGINGYVESFIFEGQERAAVLYEWALGEKPNPSRDTYLLLGKAAAQIHLAADSYTQPFTRDKYDAHLLIDHQLELMKNMLIEVKKWEQMIELSKRLKNIVANPNLDFGICHMDLTLDNVHIKDNTLTVFDLDSAGESWRALEPHGVLKFSKDYFNDWLEGYRTVRPFSKADEDAVAAFVIIGNLRVIAWKLGLASSSRGKPLLSISELPAVVDEWLKWEQINL